MKGKNACVLQDFAPIFVLAVSYINSLSYFVYEASLWQQKNLQHHPQKVPRQEGPRRLKKAEKQAKRQLRLHQQKGLQMQHS